MKAPCLRRVSHLVASSSQGWAEKGQSMASMNMLTSSICVLEDCEIHHCNAIEIFVSIRN